jgi:hypothetical protein
MRFTFLLPVVLVLALCAACADDDDTEPVAEATPTPTSVDDGSAIADDEIEGHWTSVDWGDMYLAAGPGGTTRGVYPHDLGTVTGRLENGVFVGWWCEAPTRQPNTDAGEVEFRFSRADDGSLLLDGRWKYGSEGDWYEDWDLVRVDTPIDEPTLARLENEDEFCEHP